MLVVCCYMYMLYMYMYLIALVPSSPSFHIHIRPLTPTYAYLFWEAGKRGYYSLCLLSNFWDNYCCCVCMCTCTCTVRAHAVCQKLLLDLWSHDCVYTCTCTCTCVCVVLVHVVCVCATCVHSELKKAVHTLCTSTHCVQVHLCICFEVFTIPLGHTDMYYDALYMYM